MKVMMAEPNHDIIKSPLRTNPRINPVIAPKITNTITPISRMFMGKFSINIYTLTFISCCVYRQILFTFNTDKVE